MTQPEHLYHYTSAAGLIGIFRSKEIWMTYIHSLNDSLEDSHALSLIVSYLKKRLDKTQIDAKEYKESLSEEEIFLDDKMDLSGYSKEIETLSYLIGQFESRNYVPDTFTFSLSQEKDSLSQWRGYSSNGGYSIEFSFKKLEALCNEHNCTIDKCEYDLAKQTQKIKEIFDEYLDSKSSSRYQNYCASKLEPTFRMLLDKTRDIRPLFKHESFSDEKEWRIIHKRYDFSTKQKKLPLLYRTNNEYIIPYITLDIGKKVDGIMIGPGINFERAVQSLRVLVQDKENLNCEIENITQSKSSYRK